MAAMSIIHPKVGRGELRGMVCSEGWLRPRPFELMVDALRSKG